MVVALNGENLAIYSGIDVMLVLSCLAKDSARLAQGIRGTVLCLIELLSQLILERMNLVTLCLALWSFNLGGSLR